MALVSRLVIVPLLVWTDPSCPSLQSVAQQIKWLSNLTLLPSY